MAEVRYHVTIRDARGQALARGHAAMRWLGDTIEFKGPLMLVKPGLADHAIVESLGGRTVAARLENPGRVQSGQSLAFKWTLFCALSLLIDGPQSRGVALKPKRAKR